MNAIIAFFALSLLALVFGLWAAHRYEDWENRVRCDG